MTASPLENITSLEQLLNEIEHLLETMTEIDSLPIEQRWRTSASRDTIALLLPRLQERIEGLRAQLQAGASAFIAQLPSGIRQDVETHYRTHGDLQPGIAIRHWIEIPGTHGGSVSGWTCDGYASSRQYAGMIAEALHKSFGHAYEVWGLRSTGNTTGPHILDLVPGLHLDAVRHQGERKELAAQDIREFSERWVIQHYGIHESNHRYVVAQDVKYPEHSRVYECWVTFSRTGEQVCLLMHNLPGGLDVFGLRYALQQPGQFPAGKGPTEER